MPIWLASFLAFKLDLVGAEYITSSHGISVKNATKDLNNQGSQFLPDESMEFVKKMEEILDIADKKGKYEIKFSSSSDSLIDEKIMEKLNNGMTWMLRRFFAALSETLDMAQIGQYDEEIYPDKIYSERDWERDNWERDY